MTIIGMEILGSEQSGQRFLMMVSVVFILSVFCIVSGAGKPPGSQCSGDNSTEECQCGTECLPWTPGGGSWDGTSPLYCLNTQPLAHLESCNYTEKMQLCDSGLMCEQGVCVRADKYMWEWNKVNVR